MSKLTELHAFLHHGKRAAEEAPGVPSRSEYGDLSQLRKGELLDWLIQEHEAERAGRHYDIRFGGPERGLYSWATRKELPEPGQRRAVFQQPLHSYGYREFEGEIPEGYGKGTVRPKEQGKILITNADPTKIEFTVAHRRHPERYVLLKPGAWKNKDWLLINNTPTEPPEFSKVKFKKIPQEEVSRYIDQMQEGETLEAKLDGASSLIKLLKDGIEMTSYRISKETGRPIVQTERFFGDRPKFKVPEDLIGTVLKGEIYGVKEDGEKAKPPEDDFLRRAFPATPGQVIPPQRLGGLLNASVAESLRKQKEEGVNLKNLVYDIERLGSQHIDWQQVPRSERREMAQKVIEEVLQPNLPSKFQLSPAATNPEEAQKLWRFITQTGYSPITEGAVIWPRHGKPLKGKLMEDVDVHVRNIFPGAGRLEGVGAGGFEYSLEPEGDVVGRVGTGFDDETRQDMWENPDKYVGRIARISSQQQLPSGAYRAPAFLALHEDYPTPNVA